MSTKVTQINTGSIFSTQKNVSNSWTWIWLWVSLCTLHADFVEWLGMTFIHLRLSFGLIQFGKLRELANRMRKTCIYFFWCDEFENCYWLGSYLQISTGFYFAYICVIIPWQQQPYSFFQNSELRGVDSSTTPGWLATHWVGHVFSLNRFFRIERCKEQELVMLLDNHQPTSTVFLFDKSISETNF